jgi:hypothetical protein
MTDMVLPQFGMGMADGTIIAWHKAVGDTIVQGEPICDVEAAKTTVEVVAPRGGVLQQILVTAGENVPVNTVIAIIGDIGAAYEPKETAPATVMAAEATPAFVPTPSPPTPSRSSDGPGKGPQIEPRARRAARELNLDLATILGTGPGGRIVEEDVLRAGDGGRFKAVTPQQVNSGFPQASGNLNQIRMRCDAAPLSMLISGIADAHAGPVSVEALLIRASAIALVSTGQEVRSIGLRSDVGTLQIIANPETTSARGIDAQLCDPADGPPPLLVLETLLEDGFDEVVRLDPSGPICLSVSALPQGWSGSAEEWRITLIFSDDILSMAAAKMFLGTLRDLLEKPLAILA